MTQVIFCEARETLPPRLAHLGLFSDDRVVRARSKLTELRGARSRWDGRQWGALAAHCHAPFWSERPRIHNAACRHEFNFRSSRGGNLWVGDPATCIPFPHGRRWRNAPHGGMRRAFPPYTLYGAFLAFSVHGESSRCEMRNRGARRAPRRVGLTSSISPIFLRPQRNKTFCEATLPGSV